MTEGEKPVPNESFSRRALFGRGAKRGAELGTSALAGGLVAGAMLERDQIEQSIRDLDGSVYDEYNSYIEGYVDPGSGSYHRPSYLGQVNKEHIPIVRKEINRSEASLSFTIPERQFVCLKLNGQLDENYSIGLFKARFGRGSNDREEIEHAIPVVQTPDMDEQTVYFGYLDQGEHDIEIESVPNDIYDTSEITDVEVFSVSGNRNVTHVLEHLGNVGLREDIVQSGEIVMNIPLAANIYVLRPKNSEIPDDPEDPTRIITVWEDLSGEYGGKSPEERISTGNRRVYDREWKFMLKVNGEQEVEEVVYQAKDHSVQKANPDEPFSLNIDQLNNMWRTPRTQNIVVNLFPSSLLADTRQRYADLRNPLSLLGVYEELYKRRLNVRDRNMLSSLSRVDGASQLVDRFAKAKGIL